MIHTPSKTGDFRTVRGDIGRRLDPFLQRFGLGDEDLVTGSWVPPVDVIEESDRLVLRAEVPGIPRDAIEISFAEGILSIRGERAFEKEAERRRYHRIERTYGSFSRSFTLPRTVDPEKISASFTDGILEVSVPKREEAKPRQIRIEVT